jgi:propionyl-CoA carboxylase alpha chain
MPETQTGLPDNVVVAPMPGLLTAVLVVAGERVEQGQDVAIIEAMKMENVLQAGMSGKIGMIEVATGANLNVDDVILTITPDE